MICSIEECQKEANYHAKGMCWMHYYRIRRNGTTERKNKIRKPMTASQYNKLLIIEKERERIIQLLENLAYIDDGGQEMITESKRELIELIKEETNG